MSFSHLHVASAYSLRHGVSSPQDLVARAVELDLPALALTDRDGLYGAVRFMQACLTQGLSGILGVDLALAEPEEPRRTPARGGTWKDTRAPRIVLLARGGRGWAALSRLVSGAHIAGDRGDPRVNWDLLEEFVVPGDLQVLLGPDSPVGRAISRHRFDLADRLLDRWRYVAGDNLYLEVVSHRTPPRTPGEQRPAPDLSTPTARRTWTYALERGIPAVLTNAVRYCHPR